MKKHVIIDCDPGIDDSLAIMMALSIKQIKVEGITIVCGNCPVEMGFENAKKILNKMNRLEIPVYTGCSKPLKREYINALDTHGSDGLGESFLENVPGYEHAETASEFMAEKIRTLHKKGKKCSIIALGPMTNLATLLEKDEEAFCMIERIVSMGGSFKSHGNCSPVAEYNYWVDPDAAAMVYKKMAALGRKIDMIGLDVTRQIVLTPNLLSYMKRLSPDIGGFVEKITKFYFDFHWEWEHLIGCVINDPLAVAYFVDSSICSGIEAYTDIETQGISIGQSVVDAMNFYRKEPNAVVMTKTDPVKFFKLFFSSVLKMTEDELDLIEDLIRGEKSNE